MNWFKNLVANSSTISKFLVSIVQSCSVALTTHSWTGVPSIISYALSVLVYAVPNAKVASAVSGISPDVQALVSALVAALKPVTSANATYTGTLTPAATTAQPGTSLSASSTTPAGWTKP
jgi:hypothetical protein